MGRCVRRLSIGGAMALFACSSDPGGLGEPRIRFTSTWCEDPPPSTSVRWGRAPSLEVFEDALVAGRRPEASSFDVSRRLSTAGLFVPPACCAEPACLHVQFGRASLLEGTLTSLQVGVTFPTPTGPPPPLDLIVVVDVSASLRTMPSMEAIRLGLRGMAESLDADDRLALITFRGNVELRVPLGWVDDVRSDFVRAADLLEFGGGTDLASGISMGYTLATRERDLERQSRVLVLTDGVPTWGFTSPEQLLGVVSDGIRSGTLLTGFVVGDESSDDYFEELIEGAAGRLVVLPEPSDLEAALREEVQRDTRTLFSSLRLRAEIERHLWPVLVSGTTALSSIGDAVTVEIPQVLYEPERGTVAPGFDAEGGDALFWALPVEGSSTERLARIELRYRVPGGAEYRQELDLVVPASIWSEDAPPFYTAPEVAQNLLRWSVARSIDGALRPAAEAPGADARDALATARARIEDFLLPRGEAAPLAAEDLALIQRLQDVFGEGEPAPRAEWPGD